MWWKNDMWFFSPDSDSPSNSEPKMFLQHVKIRWSCWDTCSDNFHFKCAPKLKVSNSFKSLGTQVWVIIFDFWLGKFWPRAWDSKLCVDIFDFRLRKFWFWTWDPKLWEKFFDIKQVRSWHASTVDPRESIVDMSPSWIHGESTVGHESKMDPRGSRAVLSGKVF